MLQSDVGNLPTAEALSRVIDSFSGSTAASRALSGGFGSATLTPSPTP